MSLPYGFERGRIPEAYEPLDWYSKNERCVADFGPPQTSTGPEEWQTFMDWERSPDHLLAEVF